MISIDKNIRYKLYWIDYSDPQKPFVESKLEEDNLHILDLGYEFASAIKDKEEAQVLYTASEYLAEVMERNTVQGNQPGLPIIIIKNIGIILEDFFGIDVEKFLKDLSKNVGVIILWEGTVRNNQHFLWPGTEDYALKFHDTNIQKINL